ncbi:MAG: DUF4062 domain-containing protein [Leifsonia sp.]
MAEKYQVFISSTFDDLRDEREQVIKAVLEMGHIPVGMEMFSAADEEQWEIIKRHIDESDYYVVIVAHRYGSITDGMSYTRKEYEYARAVGVPSLGFVIHPQASWPADRVDTGRDKDHLDDFKALVSQKPVGYWKNADELHAMCSVALVKAFTASPREGWVRASSAASPQMTSELSRLSAENARLREQLAEAKRESEADRVKAFENLRSTLRSRTREMSYRYSRTSEWQHDAEDRSLFWIFNLVGPMMIPEQSLEQTAQYLAMYVRSDTARDADIVPLNQLKGIFTELMALDLVAPSTRNHSLKDSAEYWSVTPFGVDFLKWLKLRELEEPAPTRTAQIETE